MIDYRPVSFADFMSQSSALLQDHWVEVRRSATNYAPDPIIEVYQALEADGKLIAFGAYCDGEMVGYSVAILGNHLHYRFLYCQHDVLFLRKDQRRGGVGLRLMQITEEAAKEAGAKFMTWHAKHDSPFKALLEKRGYGVEETLFWRAL